jgi:hypothetical protein
MPPIEIASAYQREQLEALDLARNALARASRAEQRFLTHSVRPYLDFRRRVDDVLRDNFEEICTSACYQSRRSACCSRDGIITYWADGVINVLNSTEDQLGQVRRRLASPHEGQKCLYLGPAGCLWQVRPIVCAMFLCDSAEQTVFKAHPVIKTQWDQLQEEKKKFTWPDRPVLFDDLEAWFLERGYQSSLMYMHTSPGLLRLKKKKSEN